MEASNWVRRFARLVRPGGTVLDVAAGAGRHSGLFLEAGHAVVAVDRDLSRMSGLDHPRLDKREVDLETPEGWPLPGRAFDAVVVTHYLWRPSMDAIVGAVREDGVLIYETFAAGNERHGRPSRPEFLLQAGELLRAVAPTLEVVAYEHGRCGERSPRVLQRICAVGRARDMASCPLDGPRAL